MGNSSTKESRQSTSSRSRASSFRTQPSPSPTTAGPSNLTSVPIGESFSNAIYSSHMGRGSRPELPFIRLRSNSNSDVTAEARRETKQEREARKAEKEKQTRLREREKSLREESVDGGFLVTLGTYIGPEDFSKPTVRQLQIERRLAPFWKGLNDHNDSWTEHQLVAAAKGLPIPAADEVPPPESSPGLQEPPPRPPDLNVNGLTISRPFRSHANSADNLSSLSGLQASSLSPAASSPPPFLASAFRGRSKTLASLTTSRNNNSQTDLVPQEIQLPNDPQVNGLRIEAFLYKDAQECPICFLYYPPYLNKTRCCDQPICSECFVQIKRPEPHPPEHHDDPSNPNSQPRNPEEEGLLVSEPTACPFCVQPEFGVTYEPPPFRRGLSYVNQGLNLSRLNSAMSSSSSLSSQGTPGTQRRRATSLSANAPSVITTDKIRPDWAKKLYDARAHTARRSAAATALHTAAYLMGGIGGSDTRGFGLGRRRRNIFTDSSPGASGQVTPRMPEGMSLATISALLSAVERRGSSSSQGEGAGQGDLVGGRGSSRRTRVDDLEELMMMEAIRLSLAAEDERKRKEDKEAAKTAKKEEKAKAKEQKKADKAARKAGYNANANENDSRRPFIGRSTSASPDYTVETSGKGKGVDRAGEAAGPSSTSRLGFNPLTEPTSTVNIEPAATNKTDAQLHLEQSRAQIHPVDSYQPMAYDPPHRSHLRQMSNASSPASSFIESPPESLRNVSIGGSAGWNSSFEQSPNTSGLHIPLGTTPPGGGAGLEPMFNFRSLAGVMDGEEDKIGPPSDRYGGDGGARHIEDAGGRNGSLKEPNVIVGRSRGDSGGSGRSAMSAPPEYVAEAPGSGNAANPSRLRGGGEEDVNGDTIEPIVESKPAVGGGNQYDQKHFGDVRLLDNMNVGTRQAATQ